MLTHLGALKKRFYEQKLSSTNSNLNQEVCWYFFSAQNIVPHFIFLVVLIRAATYIHKMTEYYLRREHYFQESSTRDVEKDILKQIFGNAL